MLAPKSKLSSGGRWLLKLLILGCFAMAFAWCEGAGEGDISDLDPSDDDETGDDDADGDDDDDDADDDDGFEDDDDDNDDEDDTEIDTDDVCEEWLIEIEQVLTRLMFLQDVSSSMGQETPTKWEQAKAALINALEKFDADIEFGFDIFPTTEGCMVSAPVISDTAPENGQTLIDLINATQLSRSTPLYVGMEEYLNPDYAVNFLSQDVDSYLVVVSDGSDSCGTEEGGNMGNVTPAQLAALTKQLLDEQKVMTFAIGFGTGASPDQLNAIAENGGTPFTTYIDAQNQTELEESFDQIASIVVSCTYDIGEPDGNVDMDEVNFYFDYDDGNDPVVIPYDEDCAAGVGWTWMNDEKTQVLFCEEACEKLKTGEVKQITATYGCETIVV